MRRKPGTIITPEKAEIILRDWQTCSNNELAAILGIGKRHIEQFLHRRGLRRASHVRKASFGTTQGAPCVQCGGTERYISSAKCVPCSRIRQRAYSHATLYAEREREIEAKSESAAVKTLLYRRFGNV